MVVFRLLEIARPIRLPVATQALSTCNHDSELDEPTASKKPTSKKYCQSARARGTTWKSPYSISEAVTVNENGGAAVKYGVKSSLYPDINFSLDVPVHDDGFVQVRVDEVGEIRRGSILDFGSIIDYQQEFQVERRTCVKFSVKEILKLSSSTNL